MAKPTIDELKIQKEALALSASMKNHIKKQDINDIVDNEVLAFKKRCLQLSNVYRIPFTVFEQMIIEFSYKIKDNFK